MDATIKAAWIAALRSGEYTQGMNTLSQQKDSGAVCHCVLGVLCELAIQAHLPVEKVSMESQTLGVIIFTYDGSDSVLPIGVQQWAGLESQSPVVISGWSERDMMDLNDHYKLSFLQLADIMERDLNL